MIYNRFDVRWQRRTKWEGGMRKSEKQEDGKVRRWDGPIVDFGLWIGRAKSKKILNVEFRTAEYRRKEIYWF